MRLKLAIALFLVATTAIAQHDHGSATAKKPEMDPAMMEAMMKASTPGEPHKMLGSMVGTWDTKITMWMMPGMDPMTSTGVAESKMIFGGRYVEQRFKGSFMGMPFEGIGYTGYDNIKKQYFSTWMDNMSTGFMMSNATSGDAKSMTFTGTMPDPMTGKDAPFENKVIMVDADHTNFEMWTPGPDGKNFKMMEIKYSRKK
jgi:uncharacterized protein DUF1579